MNPNCHKEWFTFDDLSNMTDQWTSDLEYCQGVFSNQSQQVDDLLSRLMANRQDLQNVHNKVVFLECLQDDVEKNIERISQYEMYMEMHVANLEKKLEALEGKNVVADCGRQHLFGLAENVYVTLKNYEEICDDSLSVFKGKFESSANDPYEAIGQVLMTQLDILEQIETKVEQVKSLAQVNDCKTKMALNARKLKQKSPF